MLVTLDAWALEAEEREEDGVEVVGRGGSDVHFALDGLEFGWLFGGFK